MNNIGAMQFGVTTDELTDALGRIGDAMDAIVEMVKKVCKVIVDILDSIRRHITKHLQGDEKYRKWWHYCNHGKRRTRKKYQRKIIKEIFK